MKSIRLTPELEAKLGRAVKRSGLRASALIRQAIDRHCDRLLADNLLERWKDDIGQFASKKRYSSRDTRAEFARILEKKHPRVRRRKAS